MSAQQGGLVLELDLILPLPAARVFRLLSDPDELAQWWGPEGFTTLEADLDLRAGGKYRLTMQPPDGAPFHLAGRFLEIDPPRRLVYTFNWEEPTADDRETIVALSLEAAADGTRVVLSQRGFATAERVQLHRNGWTESFRKLAGLTDSGA